MDAQLKETQDGYFRIHNAWLHLHYKTSIGLVILACLVELIMGTVLINSDLLTTTVAIFYLRYLVAPMAANLVILLADTIVIRSKRTSQKQKAYMVSLGFVAICFVLFTVHGVFSATYYMFAVAIMLTSIYANYTLTVITAAVSFACFLASELLIMWDPDKISIFASTLQMSNFVISQIVMTAFTAVCMVTIRFEKKKNEAAVQMEKERQYLQQSLRIDDMTGIFNRNALHTAMKAVEKSTGEKCILAIADIDHFKNVNDQYGHHLGDRCIISFADILKENCGKATPYRYGGDEFCLLFHQADIAEAQKTCDLIRARLNELRYDQCPGLTLTASFGLAEHTAGMDEARFFIHADLALYEAKEARNAIRVFRREAFYEGMSAIPLV